MPSNGFSVGRDVSLVITTPNGNLTLSGITGFSSKPMVTKLKSKLLDGTPKFGVIPDGWQGSFKLDRSDASADNYWAAQEAGYFNGQNQNAATIYETIQEADGSLTQWRYTGVILVLEDAGSYEGDKKVEQSFSFEASKRIKVA